MVGQGALVDSLCSGGIDISIQYGCRQHVHIEDIGVGKHTFLHVHLHHTEAHGQVSGMSFHTEAVEGLG